MKGQEFENTLASLQAQTFKDFEVVVHDDGSQDDSVACAREVARADARLHDESTSSDAKAHHPPRASARSDEEPRVFRATSRTAGLYYETPNEPV